MELKMDISQKQVLSQHMMQSMEILQMSAQELESYIEDLALENPVIELPDSYSQQTNTKQEDLQRKMDWLESTDLQNKVYYQQERSAENMQENWHDSRKSEENLSDYLLAQILLTDYDHTERTVIEFMILSLDSRGYFTDDISYVAEYFSVSEDLVRKLLGDIQALDPAGVGARDLRECLLLQLYRQKDYSSITEALIKDYLEEIAKNHIQNIAKKLNVPIDDILDACEQIRTLNPKPGNSFSNREQLRYISPDAIVIKLEDKFEILINEYQYPQIKINTYYQELLKDTPDKETQKYLQEKISQAQWVNNCISQRTSTLSRVVKTLVEKQNSFFLYGVGHKSPMRLTDLAAELDLHESTISRAMRGKYLQCSWGVFPLNYFLTSVSTKATNSNEAKTPEQIKILIQKIVDEEDKRKPLSDQAISQKLEDYDIKISRRTVNKYRTEMNLPDKSGRKSFS